MMPVILRVHMARFDAIKAHATFYIHTEHQYIVYADHIASKKWHNNDKNNNGSSNKNQRWNERNMHHLEEKQQQQQHRIQIMKNRGKKDWETIVRASKWDRVKEKKTSEVSNCNPHAHGSHAMPSRSSSLCVLQNDFPRIFSFYFHV